MGCVGVAADGVPAHVTLLYPFVPPDALDRGVRAAVAQVAARHRPFEFQISGPTRWPDTIYAAVEPAETFLAIHRELAAAFPDFPIYGRPPGFELVPHITVADGTFGDDPSIAGDPAWASLPARRTATALEVIASDNWGRWRLVWRVALGLQSGHAADVPPV
jgi:2'-5' RNA ligase